MTADSHFPLDSKKPWSESGLLSSSDTSLCDDNKVRVFNVHVKLTTLNKYSQLYFEFA